MEPTHPGRPIHRPPAGRRRARRLAFAATVALLIAAGQEAAFRAMFPLPAVDWFNRIHYKMSGTPMDIQALSRKGLAYDRLLFESRPDGFAEVHHLNLYGF